MIANPSRGKSYLVARSCATWRGDENRRLQTSWLLSFAVILDADQWTTWIQTFRGEGKIGSPEVQWCIRAWGKASAQALWSTCIVKSVKPSLLWVLHSLYIFCQIHFCVNPSKCISDFAPASLLWIEVADLLGNVDEGGDHLEGGGEVSTDWRRGDQIFNSQTKETSPCHGTPQHPPQKCNPLHKSEWKVLQILPDQHFQDCCSGTSTGSFSQPVSPTNLPGCFSIYLPSLLSSLSSKILLSLSSRILPSLSSLLSRILPSNPTLLCKSFHTQSCTPRVLHQRKPFGQMFWSRAHFFWNCLYFLLHFKKLDLWQIKDFTFSMGR